MFLWRALKPSALAQVLARLWRRRSAPVPASDPNATAAPTRPASTTKNPSPA